MEPPRKVRSSGRTMIGALAAAIYSFMPMFNIKLEIRHLDEGVRMKNEG